MSKTIILIRHAHRDTTDRELDNGLSDKGFKQVDILKKWLPEKIKNLEPSAVISITSPKKRCIETITPVARRTLSSVEVWDDLDEQTSDENHEKFWERIERTIQKIHKRSEDVVVVCSHGDYLPLFIFHLLGVKLELNKAGVCALDVDGKLLFYLPSLKLLNP